MSGSVFVVSAQLTLYVDVRSVREFAKGLLNAKIKLFVHGAP